MSSSGGDDKDSGRLDCKEILKEYAEHMKNFGLCRYDMEQILTDIGKEHDLSNIELKKIIEYYDYCEDT